MRKSQFIISFLCLSVLLQTSCAQNTGSVNTKKPLVVFVAGDHEYSGEATLPLLAAELEKNYGFRTQLIKSQPDQNAEENLPGLEALKDADIAVFFLRWRRLPAEQVKHIDKLKRRVV